MSRIQLAPTERRGLFDQYRRSTDSDVRLRAHILLLLDAGHPWTTISAVLFCSPETISRWKQRFEQQGAKVVAGKRRDRAKSGIHIWAALVVQWVPNCSPADFRFAGAGGVARPWPLCCGKTTRCGWGGKRYGSGSELSV